ncbi:MAG: BrnT family toxin [Nostoc sp.]|uniref:BrnT family toxin n=1 Tax=Nostoc sp. TaxID=1180 RepID=UPI002FF56939
MSELRFEWDERKARSNEQKHGVSFNEAETVFYDKNARLLYDPEHSLEEDRYIILGMSDSLRLLLVCHLYQESEEVIRIISARKATKRERQQYQSFFL